MATVFGDQFKFKPMTVCIRIHSNHLVICYPIADRMPVILGSKESTDWWLNDSSLSSLDKILKPYEETDLVRTQNLWFFVLGDMLLEM